MLYVLDSNDEDTGAMIMSRPELPNLENVAFDEGVLIQENVPVFDLHMTEECQGELYDYVWATLGGIILSGRFRKVLEAIGVDNIQYFPIRIVNDVTGEMHTDYFVANVVGLVACLDLEASEITRRAALSDKIRSIDEMHLDESKTLGSKIFRLAERATIVITNEEVRKVATEAGIRGCLFHPAEGYSTL